MKQLTRSEFNKQGTTYKSVTSPATDDQVTQITDIVESNGNLAYSVDGSNFKTITNEIQKVDDVSEIYPSANALPILGQSDDGVVYGALTNGELPLKLYKYSASDSSWEYIDQAKDNVLYLDGETGLIYEFKSVSPYFFVTSYTKTSQLANDSGFVTQSDINTAVSAEATARQNADATLQNNITAEATARANADTALRQDLDAEQLARTTADTNLQTAITTEVGDRQSADTTLQNLITGLQNSKQDTLTAGTNITIDANNVISATVPQIAVDDELSTTSENPVQNKIVTNAINGKMDTINPTGTGSLSINRAAGSSIGNNSVAVGASTTSRGEASFAEGNATQAWGAASHAEGLSTFATAQSSHSEGQSTQATGQAAHAEGFGTTASNAYSHAEGQGTHTSATAQHVFGKYNKNDANCVEIVGNGTDNTNAKSSNARTLDWSGNEVLAGTSTATGFKTPSGTSSEFLKADGSTDSTTYATSSDLSNKQDALSTAQLNAVNSGITSSLVSQISTNQTNIANEVSARESADTTLQQNIDAKYTKPSAGIPASDLVQAVVDSLNLANSALQNGSDVVTALGYTPYDATNPNGYTKVEASNTNGNIKINGSETNVYTLPSDIATDSDVSAVQSNLNAEITAREGADTTLQNNINTINGKIPTQASTTNQLADKDFVNSSINAFAAYYITKNAAGDPFATKAELSAATTFYSGGAIRAPTTNDYCIVLADESKQSETGVDPTTRYSYQGGQWEYQYTVNDTPLTAAQLAALNSGATSTNIAQISTNTSNITNLQNNKQDALTTAQLNAVNSGITSALVTQIGTNTTNISAKQDAVTSSNKLDADLVDDATSTNKFVTSAEKTSWNNKQNALNTTQLKAVNSGITSTSVEQIGTNQSNIASLQTSKQNAITSSAKLSADLVDDTNTTNKFVTSTEKTTWNGKQNALTFDNSPSPSSSNPVKSGGVYAALLDKADKSWVRQYYADKSSLATVATTGSYDDLTNKPEIPTAAIVDTVMSTTSTNPVQNKVISEALSDRLQLSKLPSTTPRPVLKNILEIESSDGGIDFTNDGNSNTYVAQVSGSDAQNGFDGLLISPSTSYGTNELQDYLLNADKFAPIGYDNVSDLGNTAERWRNLYLGGNLTDGTNSISIANIVAKQSAITSTSKLNADLVDDSSSTNKFVTGAEKSTWNGKQNAITSTNKLDYSLIANTPTIPTKTSELTNDSGFGTGTVKSVNNTSPDANGNVSITIPTDTGATSITTSGTGNAVTSASYDASTRKITLTKGSTFLTSAPVTSVSGRKGAVTTANLIADMLTGAASKGDKIASKSMGASGYITFSSGLKIAWGVANHGSSAYDWTANISFGITFSHNPTVASTPLEASGSGCWSYVYKTLSTTGCTLRQTSKPNANGKAQYIYWIAIGY